MEDHFECVSTDDRRQARGIIIPSRCPMCSNNEETQQHLIWECPFAAEVWEWVAPLFNLSFTFKNPLEAVNIVGNYSQFLKDLWKAAMLSTMVAIWRNRNEVIFEYNKPSLQFCKDIVRRQISYTAALSKKCSFDNVVEKQILQGLGIDGKHGKLPVLRACIWLPPSPNQIKVNVDGAARGNPGPAGIGASFCDTSGGFLAVRAKGIGEENNFWAESLAIVEAMEFAGEHGWLNLWIESDRTSTVQAFTTGSKPWKLKSRFEDARSILSSLVITHVWREGNLVADQMAKYASELDEGEVYVSFVKPDWVTKWEVPFGKYHRLD